MWLARTLRTTGEILITAGLVILLFVAYTLYWTGLFTEREQDDLRDQLRDKWAQGAGSFLGPNIPELELGSAVAILRIPRFGLGYAKIVIEGVSLRDLRRGPGHYPKTQYPGQVGNFVVSGHRTTYGAPFGRLDELSAQDAIVVETADTWYTYRVLRKEIVAPTAIDITLPVPHQPDATPTKKLMSMTTCHPKYSAQRRLIVFSELAETLRKVEGQLPPALSE